MTGSPRVVVVTGASGGQWITGNGTFLSSNTDLSATYMPTPAEIAAGSVSLALVTTGNGTCPSDQDTVLVTFTNSFLSASTSAIDATCANGSDGSASLIPADPAFSYQWNDPANQTTSIATGLAAGTYIVTATDAYGCDTTLSVMINEPAAIYRNRVREINAAHYLRVQLRGAGANTAGIGAKVFVTQGASTQLVEQMLMPVRKRLASGMAGSTRLGNGENGFDPLPQPLV